MSSTNNCIHCGVEIDSDEQDLCDVCEYDRTGDFVVVCPSWGDDPYTDEELRAACRRMEEWLTENEPSRVSISVRADCWDGEAPGTYRREDDGNLQILGYTLPIPEVVEDLTNRAWEHACETWPSA